MNQYKIRGISIGVFSAVLMMWVLCFCAVCVLCNWLYAKYEEGLVGILFLFAFFTVPLLVCCISMTINCATTVEIREDQIIFFRPFKKRKQLPIRNVSAYGQVAWVIKETKYYFCTTNPETIWREYEAHPDVCEELFGRSRANKLEKTERGRWQMAIGMYIHLHPSDVFYLQDGSNPNRFKNLHKFMQTAPISTGAHAIDLEYGWYQRKRQI